MGCFSLFLDSVVQGQVGSLEATLRFPVQTWPEGKSHHLSKPIRSACSYQDCPVGITSPWIYLSFLKTVLLDAAAQ